MKIQISVTVLVQVVLARAQKRMRILVRAFSLCARQIALSISILDIDL
jgi:hypothetical protein